MQFVKSGLHNRHIKFALREIILHGVVVDDLNHTKGKTKRTDYTFIPASNMIRWKHAEKKNDRETMYSLSSVVDIEGITWGKRISK